MSWELSRRDQKAFVNIERLISSALAVCTLASDAATEWLEEAQRRDNVYAKRVKALEAAGLARANYGIGPWRFTVATPATDTAQSDAPDAEPNTVKEKEG